MLSYTLQWIEDSGLKDVLLVCPARHKNLFGKYLTSGNLKSALNIKIEPYDSDDSTDGSIEALAKVSSKCTGDFVLLPCDFFPPQSLTLSSVLNQYRAATDSLIVHSVWYERPKESSEELPGPAPSPLIVYDETTLSLLHVDYSPDQEDITLRMGLAWKYPRARLSSQLVDSHVYVCKKGLLDIVAARAGQVDSFKEQLLPWLCKMQYRPSRRERYASVLAPLTNHAETDLALRYSTSQSDGDVHSVEHSLREMHISNGNSPLDACAAKDFSMRIGISVHRPPEGPFCRANNLASYIEINRRLIATAERRHLGETVDPKASISDSLVGDMARVGERAVIKKSVVGRDCVIGKGARIVGSIIGDCCIIADGAKVEGCILSRNTRVGEKAELTRCQTQAGYEIEPEEQIKGERLETNNWSEVSSEEESYDEESLLDGE